MEPPSSHLHSLRQKKQQLEQEIQTLTDKARTALRDPGLHMRSAHVVEQSYHLKVSNDDLWCPIPTAYLGPGNSARLLERLLKSTIYWHLANNLPLPKRLLPDESSQLTELQHAATLSFFPVTMDQRRLELQSLVPPSTQRAIIEHYLRVVSVEYPLLTSEVTATLLVHENPLRWSSANKDNPGALALIIVFAISSTLIARDLDPTLSTISTRCITDMHKIAQMTKSQDDRMETIRWTCTALCALALCEMINPVSGQLCDFLGRACSTIEDLREEYQLQNIGLDDAFRRLELSLLKLERYV